MKTAAHGNENWGWWCCLFPALINWLNLGDICCCEKSQGDQNYSVTWKEAWQLSGTDLLPFFFFNFSFKDSKSHSLHGMAVSEKAIWLKEFSISFSETWNKEHVSEPFLSWSVTDLCRTVLSIQYLSSMDICFPWVFFAVSGKMLLSHWRLICGGSRSWLWLILCQCLFFNIFVRK